MIGVLDESRWGEIAGVLAENGSDLPNRGRSTILADTVNGEVKAFVVIEMIGKIGPLWSSGGDTKNLLRTLENGAAEQSSFMVLAHDERLERVCRKRGFYEVEGKVFRKDF